MKFRKSDLSALKAMLATHDPGGVAQGHRTAEEASMSGCVNPPELGCSSKALCATAGACLLECRVEAKKGFADKLHIELVPVEGIRADARALDYGAYVKDYGANSWLKMARRGEFGWMTAYGALLRHITAWVGGEDIDPESGLSHLDHVGANVKFLQTFIAEDIGVDDRPIERELYTLEVPRPGSVIYSFDGVDYVKVADLV